MQLETHNYWRYTRRIDREVIRRNKKKKTGRELWLISVKCDLLVLGRHRGGDRIIQIYIDHPELFQDATPQSIGDEVELTFEERYNLGITSIRPHDVPWRDCRIRYKDARNARKRAHAASLRRVAGMQPWSESLAQTKPWEAEGLSRSTWYKRRRKSTSDESVPPPSILGGMADSCPTTPKDDQTTMEEPRMITADTVSKDAKKSARKASKAANEAHRASQAQQLPADVLSLMQKPVDDGSERVAELEEMVSSLSADNEILEAENRLFEEMKVQWQAGGFNAVIAGKDREIRALLTRVASESREKAKNLRSSEYWKAEAVKLGYRRQDSEKTP